MDKLLLTYYFKVNPHNDTRMSFRILKAFKYSVIPFFILAYLTIIIYNYGSESQDFVVATKIIKYSIFILAGALPVY